MMTLRQSYHSKHLFSLFIPIVFFIGFIDYLDKVESKHHKPLSEASKTLYYNVVSIALNKAVKDDLIPLNPATKILYSDRPRKGNATKEYLTLDEVKELIKTPCKYDMLKTCFFCLLAFAVYVIVISGGLHGIKCIK